MTVNTRGYLRSGKYLLEENSYRAIKAAKLRFWFLSALLVLAVVSIGAFIFYHQIESSREKNIGQELSQIENLYSEETQKASTNKTDVDHSQSMALFAKFSQTYQAHPYGWQAAIKSADYFISKEKMSDAKSVLQGIAPFINKFPLIQIRTLTTLATIDATEKNYDAAIQKLSQVENIQGNPFPDEAKLLKGQILFISGKTKEAQVIMTELALHSNPAGQQAKIWLSYIPSIQ